MLMRRSGATLSSPRSGGAGQSRRRALDGARAQRRCEGHERYSMTNKISDTTDVQTHGASSTPGGPTSISSVKITHITMNVDWLDGERSARFPIALPISRHQKAAGMGSVPHTWAY